MKAQEILSRGIQQVKHPNDKSFSYSGKPDFTPEQPEIKVIGPTNPQSRPRTIASKLNSYT